MQCSVSTGGIWEWMEEKIYGGVFCLRCGKPAVPGRNREATVEVQSTTHVAGRDAGIVTRAGEHRTIIHIYFCKGIHEIS
jgi:hypothetical protein